MNKLFSSLLLVCTFSSQCAGDNRLIKVAAKILRNVAQKVNQEKQRRIAVLINAEMHRLKAEEGANAESIVFAKEKSPENSRKMADAIKNRNTMERLAWSEYQKFKKPCATEEQRLTQELILEEALMEAKRLASKQK